MIKPDKIVLSNRKTLSIKIDRTGKLIVSAPKYIDKNLIFKFLNEKEKWIIEKQNAIKSTMDINNDLFNYDQILFLGKKYNVVPIKNQGEILLTEGTLCIPQKNMFSTKKITESLKKWYIQNAEVILIDRTKELLNHLNLKYKSISIINSKVKWGMCDSKKNIYLNYKLLFLSHSLIDYVIMHEIIHLIELNHSKKFYNELKRVLPDYKARQQQLKKCSFLLNLLT